jgi:preprotein translocase subunit SecE
MNSFALAGFAKTAGAPAYLHAAPGQVPASRTLAFARERRYLGPITKSAKVRLTGSPVPGGCPSTRTRQVAKVNPGEFLRQVRAETGKVVWPTRRETLLTGIMVVIMTTLLGLFFFGIDSAFSAIVQFLLGLLG